MKRLARFVKSNHEQLLAKLWAKIIRILNMIDLASPQLQTWEPKLRCELWSPLPTWFPIWCLSLLSVSHNNESVKLQSGSGDMNIFKQKILTSEKYLCEKRHWANKWGNGDARARSAKRECLGPFVISPLSCETGNWILVVWTLFIEC